jgi:hypothetical protein
MNQPFKELLENNLILETNPKLTEFDIYNKAFNELDNKIKKMMNDYQNNVEKNYEEIIYNLKTEQNRIIMALSML